MQKTCTKLNLTWKISFAIVPDRATKQGGCRIKRATYATKKTHGKLVSVVENLFLQFNIQSKGGSNPLPPVILLNSYHFFNSKNLA